MYHICPLTSFKNYVPYLSITCLVDIVVKVGYNTLRRGMELVSGLPYGCQSDGAVRQQNKLYFDILGN